MLQIRHLGYRYPGASAAALDDVGFDVARGEVLGLLGPNGAGKTTLIAHLAGLLPVGQGAITVDGLPLAEVRGRQPTRIAIAPQEYAFYPSLSVLENLDCFGGVAGLGRGARRARIAECLDFAQLARHAGTRADRLSGGLKRRLNLAIAMLPDPELLLFDEPTVGVDPQSRAFLLDSVRALAARGRAVIYTSHYMDEVEAIADRVVVIDRGRVIRQGTMAELLAVGGARLQLAVEGSHVERLLALLGRFGAAVPQSGGVAVTLPDRRALAAAIAAVDAAGLVVSHVRFGQADLEQLFMDLTQHALRD